MKSIWKRNVILIVSLLSILFSIISPTVLVSADDANEEFDKQVDEYVGDSEEFTDVLGKIQADSETHRQPSKNTMPHVMKRLFNLGEYINNVEDGVLGSDLGVEKEDILVDNRYACNPDAPNNLINHNCNIPNFTTGLIQNIVYPFMDTFEGAGKTSAYSAFGFGVPNNIPGEIVPSNPGNRAHTYTALELYGYDLKLTSYNGEWDRIEVSTQARMLSNFGVIDKITLMGTGLWNSVQAGVGELRESVSGLIENFSFNPMRWISGISSAVDTALSGGINTVVDTSDLNIVATNGWKRPNFSGTLYNVYVMTDKEVLEETYKLYFREFINELEEKAEVSPELLKVLELEAIPGFTFIPDWETEESIAARESAEATNASEREKVRAPMTALRGAGATNASEGEEGGANEEYSPNYVTVPDPVYYTEKEQLGFWEEDNQDVLDRAADEGLISANLDDYETYDMIVAEWREEWDNRFTREFNALGPVVEDLIEQSDTDVFVNNPHLDPKQPISHYACANSDGSIKRDNSGNIEYLYLKNNKGNTEYLNSNCEPARPPIGGGLFGSGWHIDRPDDTRHIDNMSSSKNTNMSFARSFNSFVAKLTNVVVGLSFSPILSELGIDSLVAELVESFKDTIFFPLAALMAIIGGILVFLQILKNGNAWELLKSTFITFLIFIAGAAFLMHPEATIKMVDEFPSGIDNFIANAVLVDDDGTSYCSTGDEADGIRSAQCNVWGIMVFNPWVHLQFGTGYDNLYANGYAPAGGNELQNTNENLVGNAAVYMGGSHTVNNWAMYQLDKTKAGTINSFDSSNLQAIGKVDKNMYRLVDLQAGPNDGAGTDSKYFESWSSADNGGAFIAVLTTLQSIVVSIAIIGLGMAKIEASLMFSMSIVFLPLMLLYALLPQGKMKLRGYISGLGSLLLKRVVATVIFAVLLKTLSLLYSRSDSITMAALTSIAISIALIIYRKELLNLITVSEVSDIGSQIKQLAAESVPTSLKQKYHLTKAKVTGSATGFAGGAIGASVYKVEQRRRQSEINNQLKDYYEKDKDKLTDKELEVIEELKKENENITHSLNNKNNNIFEQAIHGGSASSNMIGKRTERSIRREGFTVDKVARDAREQVLEEGADSIKNKLEPTALDTYKEVLSHTEGRLSKTTEKKLSAEDARALQDPKIQRQVRKLADKRDKLAKENHDKKDFNALTPDMKEIEKLAEIVDKRRKANIAKNIVRHPFVEREINEERKAREKGKNINSNAEDIKKQLLEKEKEEKNKKERGGNDDN